MWMQCKVFWYRYLSPRIKIELSKTESLTDRQNGKNETKITQKTSKSQERSATALGGRTRALLPLPGTSILLDVAQRSEALQERRVGVVPHGEQPVSHGEAQVVLVQLNEGRVELRGFAHGHGERIRLELVAAAQDGETEGQELQREQESDISQDGLQYPGMFNLYVADGKLL